MVRNTRARPAPDSEPQAFNTSNTAKPSVRADIVESETCDSQPGLLADNGNDAVPSRKRRRMDIATDLQQDSTPRRQSRRLGATAPSSGGANALPRSPPHHPYVTTEVATQGSVANSGHNDQTVDQASGTKPGISTHMEGSNLKISAEPGIVDIINEPSMPQVGVDIQGLSSNDASTPITTFPVDPQIAPTQLQAEQQSSSKLNPSTHPAQQLGQGPYFYDQGHPSALGPGSQYSLLQNMQQSFAITPTASSQNQQLQDQQTGNAFQNQNAPTQLLYERARQAATAKASPSNRRAGAPSQRRPWTQEEENALMAGLDRVKGPHWSQILGMFGPGGSINEVLKDRNQVQLKDKARNLKLFFLKSGHEVPYYLQFVTGELKTRAPAQAAKNEAREKEKMSEERAHVQGVMALASTASGQGGERSTTNSEDVEGSSKDAEGSPDGNTEAHPTSMPQQPVNIAPMFPTATAGFDADFQAQLAAAAAAATGEASQ